jgi:DNA-binding GntR family transcriptional regulator
MSTVNVGPNIGRTIAEAIASELRADIAAGRFKAGERLRQVELAARFNVSTTPVREALGLLQREGLVRIHPQRGASVFVPTIDDLEEHYELRIALESLAIGKAAQAITPEAAGAARDVLDQMADCDDPARYVALNHEFHMTLYELSGRARLVEMIDALRNASNAYLQIYAANDSPSERIDREHRQILAACEAHNPDMARVATAHHLNQTLENVTRQLREYGRALASPDSAAG